MPYINPVPYLDMTKEFEIRLKLVSDEVLEVNEAKRKCAEYIQSLPIDELCKLLRATLFPVYPDSEIDTGHEV